MSLTGLDYSTTPPTRRELQCDSSGRLIVSGATGGDGGTSGGLTNTELRAAAVAVSGPVTDAQLRAAALPVSVAALPLPVGAATAAAQATAAASLSSIDTNQGAKADVRATWYDSAASLVALLKLSIAAYIGAGSHAYGYTGGQLTTDAWTLFGTTRTKTYTYTSGMLTAESDWV